MPCLTYQRIDTPRVLTMDENGVTGDLAHPRFQFTAWGTTAMSVKAISDQIRAALNGKSGTLASPIAIQAGLVQNEAPDYLPDVRLYRSISDFEIWHVE
jgi:hypothetical protein